MSVELKDQEVNQHRILIAKLIDSIRIDRLTMILTNSQSLREVIAFPTLKSKI